MTDTGLAQLLDLPALESPNLRHTHVTEEGLRRFRAAQPKVQVVR